MKTTINYFCLFAFFLLSCGRTKEKQENKEAPVPKVIENGSKIIFPKGSAVSFFVTEVASDNNLHSEFVAPAKIAATVVKSEEGAEQNIVLFENSELAGNFTQLLEHLININQIKNVKIKQRKIELDRIKDLNAHGAATGRDLLEAQTALSVEETNLANEKAAIIEHETKLKANGFDPELLRKAVPGTAYVICDIPENQIGRIKEGSNCSVQFTSFPNEKYEGKVDNITDMVDQVTRMAKLRITLNNSEGKLKAGMFATVTFGVSEQNTLNIDKNALITVQAKNYVFVKINDSIFERREVDIGNQVNDKIVIYSGVKSGESVIIKGALQLKGLSFGY